MQSSENDRNEENSGAQKPDMTARPDPADAPGPFAPPQAEQAAPDGETPAATPSAKADRDAASAPGASQPDGAEGDMSADASQPDGVAGDTPADAPEADEPAQDDEPTQDGEPAQDDAPGSGRKKPFRFIRPIEEMYDGAPGPEEQAGGAQADTAAPGGADAPADAAVQNEAGEEAAASQEQAMEPAGAPRRGRFWRRLFYALTIVVVSVVLAMFILSVFADRYGIGKSDGMVDVIIPKGAGSKEVADILKEAGVINNPLSFRLFVRQNHISGFQQGTYSVNPAQGYEEIIAVLRDPNNNKNNVSFQVKEGQTISQISAALAQAGVCTEQDFLNTLDAGSFDFPLGAQIPDDKNRYDKYEGYLFPDSYTLLKNSSGKAAVQKMLDNFSAKFTTEMAQKAQQRGLTVDQAVTLASIVQKEGDTPNDRQNVMKHVASVFYNRLNKGVNGKKLLQSDATVLYAKRDLSAKLQSADAALASNYNTYRFEGLPPGPICSPGMDAINAVLDPLETNDFYFVSDASGNYYFAQDFKQHQKNVQKAAKKGATKATGDLSSASK